MTRASTLWIALLLAWFSQARSAAADEDNRSLQELEERLVQIDAELDQLARFSLRSGLGAIGYRSDWHDEPGGQEWVQVDFDQAYPIDEIVLVPTLWRDSKEGFKADGFPKAFQVVAGSVNDPEGAIIATYDEEEQFLPRIAPLVIPTHEVSASWIRIEATSLSRRAFNQQFIFQLSELMAFCGDRNVALHRPVRSSSEHRRDLVHAWDKAFLVDGHTPYLMDGAQGEPSVAYIGSVKRHPTLTLDLGQAYPISEIHLHAVDQNDTVPPAYPGNLGVPPQLKVEGAMREDFSDVVPLLSLESEEITDVGPVMMWLFPETTCRYVRIRCPDPETKARFGFAEIELFSRGENVALGRPVAAPLSEKVVGRSADAMTDGRNLYGNILSTRSWMNQLARRHDLESERPRIAAALNRRYTTQKRNLQLMSWLAALLAGAVAFTILIDRMLRMRQATKMRERFAADLHDEIGANIHTIGLLGDLAREAGSREELLELLDRSRVFTERSGVAIRNWTKKLEARGVCEDLVEDMRFSAASLLADLDHEISFEGEQFIDRLKPRRRIYVYLFYKECLTNIIRHSGATHVVTDLKATPNNLTLSITDNGHGHLHEVPASLKRRARLLRANVTIEKPSEGGTRIVLILNSLRSPLFQSPIPSKP